uniref:HTH CENPB-type domain-containing protein n=1 Tax=Biomphalaria glabrata TaxID=6526 RepID=A0A2C9KBT2_BIOGL
MSKKCKRIVHDLEVVKAAIHDIKVNGISIRQAAKIHNIPSSTLNDKVSGRQPLVPNRSLLTKEEENKLVLWVIELFKCGFRKSNEEVRETARAIIAARKINSESQEQIQLPTRQWLHGFYARHPEIPRITIMDLQRKMETISPSSVELWFKKLQETINSIDPSILSSPNRIFNADEMGFQFDTKSNNVKACKGSKNVYKIKSDTQTQVTVLACCNAVGQYIPPLLIYPCKETPTHNLLENFPEALLQLSDNGWITSAFFFSWLKHIFIPSTNHLPKPILLLVDSHTSHTSFLEISPICSQNNIILYCLLPHASDIIQPLNQAFLSIFKPAWSDALKQHVANTGKGVKLESFAGVLKSVWNKVTTPEIASDSFKAAGIFPLNPSKIINNKNLWLKQAYSSEATEDDIPKSPCTSLFQAPSEAFTFSEAQESTSPVLQESSTPTVPPETSTPTVPPETSTSSISLESSTSPVPPESTTDCLPLKLEDSCEISASLALAETSTSHFASKLSLDDYTSLVSPDSSTSEASLENPISTPMTINVQQIDALKEHSYFIFEEMTKAELSMFFSRLTNPQTQIFSNPYHEEKFKHFLSLTHAIIQACKDSEDPLPKTTLTQESIFKVPTLKEKGKGESRSPVTTPTLPSSVNGEELRLASKRKSPEKEEMDKRRLANKLGEKKQRRAEKEDRRLLKELRKMEKKKRKEERTRKKAKRKQFKRATLPQDKNCGSDLIVQRDMESKVDVLKDALLNKFDLNNLANVDKKH